MHVTHFEEFSNLCKVALYYHSNYCILFYNTGIIADTEFSFTEDHFTIFSFCRQDEMQSLSFMGHGVNFASWWPFEARVGKVLM